MYVANNYRLVEQFQSVMKENFGAPAQSVNFGADDTRMTINKWVEEFTHSKIKDLLPGGTVQVIQILCVIFHASPLNTLFTYGIIGSIDSLTRLVLVNAVYFKGDWITKFDTELTVEQPFFLGSEDSQINVPMMNINGMYRVGNFDQLDARILRLPYKVYRLHIE